MLRRFLLLVLVSSLRLQAGIVQFTATFYGPGSTTTIDLTPGVPFGPVGPAGTQVSGTPNFFTNGISFIIGLRDFTYSCELCEPGDAGFHILLVTSDIPANPIAVDFAAEGSADGLAFASFFDFSSIVGGDLDGIARQSATAFLPGTPIDFHPSLPDEVLGDGVSTFVMQFLFQAQSYLSGSFQLDSAILRATSIIALPDPPAAVPEPGSAALASGALLLAAAHVRRRFR